MKNIAPLFIQQPCSIGHQLVDPPFGFCFIVQKSGQKLQHVENVGIFTGNRITDKNPERFFNIKIGQLRTMCIPEILLLIKTQQAGGKVLAGNILVGIILLFQIENQRLFAVTIFIEKLVGVIEQNAFGINFTGCQRSGLSLFIAGQHQLLLLGRLQFFQIGGIKKHF